MGSILPSRHWDAVKRCGLMRVSREIICRHTWQHNTIAAVIDRLAHLSCPGVLFSTFSVDNFVEKLQKRLGGPAPSMMESDWLFSGQLPGILAFQQVTSFGAKIGRAAKPHDCPLEMICGPCVNKFSCSLWTYEKTLRTILENSNPGEPGNGAVGIPLRRLRQVLPAPAGG